MKKFTKIPIGLGINHIEQEESITRHWNHCIDNGYEFDEFIEVPEVAVRAYRSRNMQTGLSIENTEAAIEKDGKWKLSDSTIDKCKKYLEI